MNTVHDVDLDELRVSLADAIHKAAKNFANGEGCTQILITAGGDAEVFYGSPTWPDRFLEQQGYVEGMDLSHLGVDECNVVELFDWDECYALAEVCGSETMAAAVEAFHAARVDCGDCDDCAPCGHCTECSASEDDEDDEDDQADEDGAA